MEACPLDDEPEGARLETALEHGEVFDRNQGLGSGVDRMEVGWRVLTVVHSNRNAEELGDRGHLLLLSDSPPPLS